METIILLEKTILQNIQYTVDVLEKKNKCLKKKKQLQIPFQTSV